MELIWKDSFLDLDPLSWDALVPSDNPFYKLQFLQILEKSSSIGKELAWQPRPLLAYDNGVLVGIFVLFLRYDSYGEYIFDFEWASLYQRAGLPYYPKLTSAIPFTPVTCHKLLTHPDRDRKEIAMALLEETKRDAHRMGVSTIHVLFHLEEEKNYFQISEFMPRATHQFHWINRGYGSFDEFLQALKKDRRKSIRKERENLGKAGIRTEILEGEAIDESLWELFYQFYKNTHSKKWGRAYLTQEFFRLLFQEGRESLVLLLAFRDDKPVGGSLNFRGENVLYGRYWGAIQEIPFLHFEACYYGLIDYSIQKGLARLEAGAQGEHKYLRGFEVVPIHSSHYFTHAQLRGIFEPYLSEERAQVEVAIRDWNLQSPLKIFREEKEE